MQNGLVLTCFVLIWYLLQKKPEIIEDFVFGHFQFYQDQRDGTAHEFYVDPYSKQKENVFDKATYVESISFKKTRSPYKICLQSSGLIPEFITIDPSIKRNGMQQQPERKDRKVCAEPALDQSPEYNYTGITPNPKIVYVYRNGFQGRNSSGGKNVKYKTDRLTFVYDFSSLKDWQKLIAYQPAACLKKAGEDFAQPIEDVKWNNGVAIVRVLNLDEGDKVRIYWTWKKSNDTVGLLGKLSCEDTL